MRKIAMLLLLLFSLESIAQTYEENLEKYWYYRHRLKEQFMYFSGDASIQGSHHVAENKYDNQQFIRWSDGIWWLGHYIGVLALEYKLLKTNGEDYSGTLNELYQAFETYYRLDYNAEPCFENVFGQQGDPTVNGFFLRDDLDTTCAPYFDDYEIKGDYHHCGDGTESNVNSQDQCIAMFLGLSLVKKLVDDEQAQQYAINIADLVINSMHWFNKLVMHHIWEIRNPVTWGVPQGGNVYEMVWNVYADAQAATIITGTNQHVGFSGSPQSKNRFDVSQSQVLSMLHDDIFDKFVGYFTSVNSTLINDGQFFSSPIPDHLAYNWLYNLYNETKGFEGMPDNIGLFPHLPLITEILHGYNGNNQMPASEIENGFLNVAPPCGSYVHLDGNKSQPPWHTMSLFCPWHGENSDRNWKGEYNMLDYMMLYNAYFLIYLRKEHSQYVFDNNVYPTEDFEIEWDINGYPDTIWLGTYHHTCSEPQILKAIKKIDTKAVLEENGGVQYYAGENVRFLPGFRADAGSCLTAQIDPDLLQSVYYHETFTDPCSGGSFEPLEVDYVQLSLLHEDNLRADASYMDKFNIKHAKSINNRNNELTGNVTGQTYQRLETNSVTLFPNPTTGMFTINLPESNGTIKIEVTSPKGQQVLSKTTKSTNVNIDLSGQNPGMYFVNIITDSMEKRLKIIKL